MLDSFLKGWSGQQGPAQLRNLLRAEGPGWQLFEGAEGDAVGLAQGAVDGAGFGHAHLGVVEDEGGDIAGMGIAKAHKPAAIGRLVDGGFEDPEVFLRSTKWENGLCDDARTPFFLCELQEFAVRDVLERFKGPRRYGFFGALPCVVGHAASHPQSAFASKAFSTVKQAYQTEGHVSSVFSCQITVYASILLRVARRAFIGFRVNPELKKQLEEIALREERSLSQICEIVLRKGVKDYRKEGHKYLHRLLPAAQTKE
jgi:hypothetical protein